MQTSYLTKVKNGSVVIMKFLIVTFWWMALYKWLFFCFANHVKASVLCSVVLAKTVSFYL